jgi:opacity protein-like surface antigen
MRKHMIAGLLILLAAAGLGSANTLNVRLNYFVPRAQGTADSLWKIEFENMSYARSGFQEAYFGIGFEYFLSPNFGLLFEIDPYSKSKSGFYKGYSGIQLAEGDFAFPEDYQADFTPGHSLSLTITPIQLSVKIAPLGRRGKLIPYFGGGIGFYLWSLRMRGDMVDFSDEYVYEDPQYGDVPIYPITTIDAWEGDSFGKVAIGWQAFAGLMFPIANRLTIDLGFKYSQAKGGFTESFQGFDKFDLGGYHIMLGMNYWF